MKRKRRGLRIFLWILGAVVLVAGGFSVFILSGMDSVSKLEIGDVSAARLADGAYEGAYDGNRWANEVRVTVQDGKITDIEIVKKQAFAKQETMDALISRVTEAQSARVDAVSGATLDSKAFLKAVENALTQVGR